MSTRPLPAWRYTIRQTVAMVIVASAAFTLFAAFLTVTGIDLSEPTHMLPLTK